MFDFEEPEALVRTTGNFPRDLGRNNRPDITWKVIRVLNRENHDSGDFADVLAVVSWNDKPMLERRIWKLDGSGKLKKPLKLRPLRKQDLEIVQRELKVILELVR
ncbi:MAG: hypothetical protein C4532_13825 [Candidatus Abyssobacteria bacterium SURF_17]|uniref:Uncharacterized protein n=1 Tax=Candidatus Abyssobacteria bacterium SURF_17 TaxID=2093361 RepID=A0A419EUG8_9BACT|nr:MAG: hypothetical protein C4532_13825 [Candidatus Abyssubacteria bacterium SURF_17]